LKAVGYKKSLPVDDADSLIDFETAKPSPWGHDIRVAVKAISANPVDYKVRKRAAPPEGEPRFSATTPPASSTLSAPMSRSQGRRRVSMPARSSARAPTRNFIWSMSRIVGQKSRNAVVRASSSPAADLVPRGLLFDRSSSARASIRALLLIRRRRRRGRLDPDSAGATPHRPDGGSDGVAAGIAKWCLDLGAHAVIDHAKR